MAEIYAKIAGYQKSLKRGGSGSAMKDSWRKIGWSLFKKEDIKEMRRRLSDCAQSITTLLSVSQSYVPCFHFQGSIVVSSAARCWHFRQSLRRLEQVTRGNGLTLMQLSRRMEQLPRMLGYSWEGDMSAANDHIVFHDMLGHKGYLPFQVCVTQEVQYYLASYSLALALTICRSLMGF